ncbi:MAG: hypothetical protein Q7R73_04910 [bacterium]|nr:hypothetical protein [bacterium]
MGTITIPRKIIKGEDLVAISRKEYEEYLLLRKVIPVVKMTFAEKQEWGRAKKDYARGEYVTIKELQRELDSSHTRKS